MNRVVEAMNPFLLSISPERAISDAVRAMADRRVHHLVVMRHGDVVGVVCDCDVKLPDQGTPISDVMAQPVVSLPADASVDDALALMERERIGFLPIVEDGEVIGVLTRGDLARALGEEQERSLMLACRSCGSHRHVNFVPMSGAALCDVCASDEEDLGVGEGD